MYAVTEKSSRKSRSHDSGGLPFQLSPFESTAVEYDRSGFIPKCSNGTELQKAEMAAMASENEEIDSRRIVNVNPERVTNVSSTDFPGHYPGEEEAHTWSLDKFRKNLKVRITRLSNRSVEFDLVGVDASIANALRRIMIADVPTMCIEQVYVLNNTSVIHDEVLAQRLGLIPLNVDPDLFVTKGPDDPPTDQNTLVFTLAIECTRNTSCPPDERDPEKLYNNSMVYSGHLVWNPQGEQAEKDDLIASKPGPTNPNIVLAKLRPGQCIDMEVHAVKGVGREHAKWSPVATASYRLLPYLSLNSATNPVPPDLAEKFARCFSPGVIRIDPKTKALSVDKDKLRGESMSREVFRHPEFAGCVNLGRVRDWFLFNVESEGPYAPERIPRASIRVMREKIANLKRAVENLRTGGEDSLQQPQGYPVNGGDGDVVMMES